MKKFAHTMKEIFGGSPRAPGYKLRSGRIILGEIVPSGVRGVYVWSSRDGDGGVTSSLQNAIRLVAKGAGVSARTHEITLEDVENGKSRRVR